jgi:hypothetical protein
LPPRRPPRLRGFSHPVARTTGRIRSRRPFWPLRLAPARCFARQRLVLLGVYGLGFAHRTGQLPPGVGEGGAHPPDRPVDSAEGDRDTEHLTDDVADLAAREPVDAGQGGDMRLQARPEGRWGDARRQLHRRFFQDRRASCGATLAACLGIIPLTLTA